jgi:hypothetical protein
MTISLLRRKWESRQAGREAGEPAAGSPAQRFRAAWLDHLLFAANYNTGSDPAKDENSA